MRAHPLVVLAAVLVGCPGDAEPELPTAFTLDVALHAASESAGTLADVATVTLNVAAVDPVQVFITTDDTGALEPVARFVIVAPGSTTATLGLIAHDDNRITGDRDFMVHVDALALPTRSFPFTLRDDEARTVSLTGPAALEEGTVDAKYRIETEGLLGGAVAFSLSVDPPGALALPPSLTLEEGARVGEFSVSVPDNALLDFDRAVTLHAAPAELLDTPEALLVAILDDEPATLTLQALASNLSEGDGLVAEALRVILGAPAASDLTVSLLSDRPDLLQVVSSVTVPAGASQVDVALELIDNATLDLPQVATLTASAPGLTGATHSVPVADDEVADFRLQTDMPSLSEGQGVVEAWASVSVGAILTYDLDVQLTSSDTSELIVPTEVRIESGSDQVAFPATVVDDDWMDFNQTVTVSAEAPPWSDELQVLVHDDEPNTLALEVADVAIYEDNASLTDVVTVHTGAPVEHDFAIAVASSDDSELLVQPSVEVLAGASSASVALYPVEDGVPDLDQEVTLTASAPGCVSAEAQVIVRDQESGYVVALEQGPDQEQYVNFGSFPGLVYDSDWALAEKFMIPVGAEVMGYQLFRGSAFQDLPGDFSVNVRVASDPQVSMTFLPVTMNAGEQGVTLTEGQWHTLVAQYDLATTTVSLYVDGVLVDSAQQAAWDDRDNHNPLVWGGQFCDEDKFNCSEFDIGGVYLESDGILAHLALWQRTLTSEEISDYDGSVDLTDEALVFATAIGPGLIYDLVGSHPGVVFGDPVFYRP